MTEPTPPCDLFDAPGAAAAASPGAPARRRGAAELRDLWFPSPLGSDAVTATLVSPERAAGPALLFQHWGFGSRRSFESEAVAYAASGVTSLLVDAPGYGPRRGPRPYFRDATIAARYAQQAVTDLRRALDVLAARSGVDAERLGFVGHSLGASVGGQLAGSDARVRAAVLMAGLGEISRGWLTRASPEGARTLAPLDGVAWIGRSGAAFLLQFAERDEFVSREAAERFAAAAPEPRRVAWYACDHALGAEALRERAGWLAAQLGFAAPGAATLHGVALPRADRWRYGLIKPLLALARRS